MLRRNLFKARHVIQQHYGVTIRMVYAVTLLLWKVESSESALRGNMDTYVVTSFKLARWKVRVSGLWRKPLKVPKGDQGLYSSKNSTRSPREIILFLLLYLIISFDYHVPLDFGSIAGGLNHVNPVIRLPIEHGISRLSEITVKEGISDKEMFVEGDDIVISWDFTKSLLKPRRWRSISGILQ
ncbi:hypothetical protein Tco_0418427 [Tanacetum coccineum]